MIGSGMLTEEELDRGDYYIEGDELCVNCEMRKSKHAAAETCLFSPRRFEAMTPQQYWATRRLGKPGGH